MRRMTVTDKRIWVTGASSGIGKAVAAKLAALGNQVIISGRTGEALAAVQRLYPGHVTCLPFDITDTEDTMRAAEQIRSEFGALDVAVLRGARGLGAAPRMTQGASHSKGSK